MQYGKIIEKTLRIAALATPMMLFIGKGGECRFSPVNAGSHIVTCWTDRYIWLIGIAFAIGCYVIARRIHGSRTTTQL